MNLYIRINVLLFCAFTLCSCFLFRGSDKVSFKPDAVSVNIKGDPQLNLYQNRSHTVYLCIYQLKDPNGFIQLADERGGIEKLMGCNPFDATVANCKRIVVQPGQVLSEMWDRAEGSRFIGVVAGYYDLKKEHVVRLNGISGSKIKMNIDLGAQQILNVKVK